MTEGPAQRRAAEALALGGIAALGAAVLALSWNRWLDPIVDLGRDLYVPEAMASGAALYADLLYYYPPLAPLLLAAAVALFGSSLALYTAIGIVTAAIAATSLYLLIRATSGWAPAAAIAMLFVALHLAGTSTWGANFVFPYAHAAIFGMTFFLLFAASIGRYLFVRASAASAWCAVAFGVLSASAKIEYVLAVALVVAVAVVVYRFPLRFLVAMAVAGAAVFAAAAFAFGGAPPGHRWLRDNVFAAPLLTSDAAGFFYGSVSGTASLAASLGRAAVAALLLIAAIALLAAADRALARGARILAGAAILAAMGALVLMAGARFFAGWPLLMLALLPFAARERATSPLAFLLAISLGTAARIFLSLGPGWYGFVLVLPTYALVAYVLTRWLPGRGVYRRGFAAFWLVLAVAIGARGIAASYPSWRARSFEVRTARGAYLDEPRRGSAVRALLEWLARRPGGETMAVMPEGLAINYFAARRTPLSFHTFTPIEIDDPAIERRLVAEIEERRPDLVVIVPRDVREFGYRGFGVDYARDIAALLRQEYRLAWRSGARPEIVALERR
ncbi:MAG TPA: hypothetical protein VGF40_10680 [Thermoanaerobaculia bacterium]